MRVNGPNGKFVSWIKPRKCLYCGEEFRPRMDRFKYCSVECSRASRRRGEMRSCPICGEGYWAQPAFNRKYCSRKCYHESQKKLTAEKSFSWIGGIVKHGDYTLVYMPEHPKPKSGRYIYEHRAVMEERIGRCLEPNEVVHHVNGDKADNRLENLELMTNSDHTKLHKRLRENSPWASTDW